MHRVVISINTYVYILKNNRPFLLGKTIREKIELGWIFNQIMHINRAIINPLPSLYTTISRSNYSSTHQTPWNLDVPVYQGEPQNLSGHEQLSSDPGSDVLYPSN